MICDRSAAVVTIAIIDGIEVRSEIIIPVVAVAATVVSIAAMTDGMSAQNTDERNRGKAATLQGLRHLTEAEAEVIASNDKNEAGADGAYRLRQNRINLPIDLHGITNLTLPTSPVQTAEHILRRKHRHRQNLRSPRPHQKTPTPWRHS